MFLRITREAEGHTHQMAKPWRAAVRKAVKMRQSVWVFLGIVLLKAVVWAGPELFVENNVFDFGKVVDGTIVKHVYLLKNIGDAPVTIPRISHTCGCTSHTLSAREIATGEAAALTVWFDTTGYVNYPQPVSRVLTIFSTDPNGPREVWLEGRVLTVRPSTAGKTPSESELPVTSKTNAPPKPTLVSLQVDLVTSEDAKEALPHPVRDVRTTHFIVRGVKAERIRVEVYDLTGRLVWQNEASGNEIVWHTQDLTGLPLANGVYLCKVFVLYGGEWIASAIQKLVILQ